MAATDSPELEEAREVISRALKLSPAAREGIALQLIQSLESPPGPLDSDKDYWRAEIARRIEAIKNGTMTTYTLEEAMAYLQTVVEEDSPT